jgi:hypothetical protein
MQERVFPAFCLSIFKCTLSEYVVKQVLLINIVYDK